MLKSKSRFNVAEATQLNHIASANVDSVHRNHNDLSVMAVNLQQPKSHAYTVRAL